MFSSRAFLTLALLATGASCATIERRQSADNSTSTSGASSNVGALLHALGQR